jgi:hypothetical protein
MIKLVKKRLFDNNLHLYLLEIKKSWGGSTHGGSGEPTDSDYIKIYSTEYAFAALKADGSITAWGNSKYGGIGAPRCAYASIH